MTTSPANTRSTSDLWPVVLCWIAVALDGFDLVVIGAVIPTLTETGDLGFTPASLTMASTVGLIGVGIGAVLIGPVIDRFGRRGGVTEPTPRVVDARESIGEPARQSVGETGLAPVRR